MRRCAHQGDDGPQQNAEPNKLRPASSVLLFLKSVEVRLNLTLVRSIECILLAAYIKVLRQTH